MKSVYGNSSGPPQFMLRSKHVFSFPNHHFQTIHVRNGEWWIRIAVKRTILTVVRLSSNFFSKFFHQPCVVWWMVATRDEKKKIRAFQVLSEITRSLISSLLNDSINRPSYLILSSNGIAAISVGYAIKIWYPSCKYQHGRHSPRFSHLNT